MRVWSESTEAEPRSFPGRGVRWQARNDLAMPWLVGEGETYRLLPKGEEMTPLDELLNSAPSAYVGFLHPGFAAALEAGAFRPYRVALALRAGWLAVGITAAVREPQEGKRLAPFAAPTSPGPRRRAPLGFCLFSSPWLGKSLPLGELGVARSSLEWCRRLNGLLDVATPVFCDPELELEFDPEEGEEMTKHDPYRRPASLDKAWAALSSLGAPRWEASRR